VLDGPSAYLYLSSLFSSGIDTVEDDGRDRRTITALSVGVEEGNLAVKGQTGPSFTFSYPPRIILADQLVGEEQDANYKRHGEHSRSDLEMATPFTPLRRTGHRLASLE
jgi:hypothetical protein